MSEVIAELVARAQKEHHRRLEQACEAAVQGGTCGVAVVGMGYGGTIAVDPLVPYGNVYEFRTPEDYQRWSDR